MSRSRERNMRASQKFIDCHVPTAGLHDADVCSNGVTLYSDFNGLFDALDQRAGNPRCGLGIRSRQADRKLVITNASKKIIR